MSRFRFPLAAVLTASLFSLPSLLHAQVIITPLGTGNGALLGGDLTDPEDDGQDVAGAENDLAANGWNFVGATPNEEPGFEGGEFAFNLFDNKVGAGNDKWCCNARNITIQFAEAISLTHFTMASGNDAANRDWRVWRLLGSTNGSTFTPIYEDPGTTRLWPLRSQVLRFDLPEPSPPYTHFRFEADTNWGDGLWQIGELELFGTADLEDTDSDGMTDVWETQNGLDPNNPGDAALDADADGGADGLTNLEEFELGTDPQKADTDEDGLLDGVETGTGTYVDPGNTGTDPVEADSDNDGLLDGIEDNSGVFGGPMAPGTNPNNPNTDGDGLPDGVELALNRNPLVPDDPGPPTTRYEQNFNGYPDGTLELGDFSTFGSTNGAAAIEGDQLRLTSNSIGSTHASYRIPPLRGSSEGWTASFDFTLIDTAGQNPADGFSFSYGAIPELSANDASDQGHGAGEESWSGLIPWISVEIDTWNSGAGEAGVNVASNTSTHPDFAFVPGLPLEVGGTRSGSASISWDPDLGLSVMITGLANEVNLENIEIPDFTGDDEFIFAFSGRTGGATQTVLLDNVSVVTGATDRYRFDVTSPDNGGNLEFRWNSTAGEAYSIVSTDDPESNPNPATWTPVPGLETIVATPPENVETTVRPADPQRFYRLLAGPIPPLFSDDLENGQGDWTVGFDSPLGETVWALGAPAAGSGPISGADNSANAFTTNLAEYAPNADTWLRTPVIDLGVPGLAGATLTFQQFRDTDGAAETGVVRVLRADGLQQLGPDLPIDLDTLDLDWVKESLALPAEALGESVVIEFRFTSDGSPDPYSGWSIDNIEVTAD